MQPDEKTCPYCAETIKAAAVKCRFCGSMLGPAPGGSAEETTGGVSGWVPPSSPSRPLAGVGQTVAPTQGSQKFETKHLTVPPDKVDEAIREHQVFYWELIGTDTVDHVGMQAGAGVWGDGLFFVPYQQRTAYTKINFRRSAGTSNYEQVRAVERQYAEIGQRVVSLLQRSGSPLLLRESAPGGAELVLAVLLGLVSLFLAVSAMTGPSKSAAGVGIAAVVFGAMAAYGVVARQSKASLWRDGRAQLLSLLGQRQALLSENRDLLNLV